MLLLNQFDLEIVIRFVSNTSTFYYCIHKYTVNEIKPAWASDPILSTSMLMMEALEVE